MTLDPSKPTDQVLVSEIPSYIRANRVVINAIDVGDSDFTQTELELVVGTTSMTVGDNLSDLALETIKLSATGACTLDSIYDGTQGQIKVFHIQDNNISFVDGTKSDGNLYLNQLPVLSTYNAQQDDIIAFVNAEGDGGTTDGYWKELWRQISVK